MDVSESMELVHGGEHFADIESSMFLLQNTGIVQERPEVAPRDVLHREVDVIDVLEGVEKSNQPRRLGRRQDVALD